MLNCDLCVYVNNNMKNNKTLTLNIYIYIFRIDYTDGSQLSKQLDIVCCNTVH